MYSLNNLHFLKYKISNFTASHNLNSFNLLQELQTNLLVTALCVMGLTLCLSLAKHYLDRSKYKNLVSNHETLLSNYTQLNHDLEDIEQDLHKYKDIQNTPTHVEHVLRDFITKVNTVNNQTSNTYNKFICNMNKIIKLSRDYKHNFDNNLHSLNNYTLTDLKHKAKSLGINFLHRVNLPQKNLLAEYLNDKMFINNITQLLHKNKLQKYN